MSELQTLQTEAAKRFLQTVLIVDDRASVDPEAPPPEPVEEVVEPSGPDLGVTPGPLPSETGESSSRPSEEEESEQEMEVRASEVDVKQLADLFADLDGLTCGMLKPTENQDRREVTARIVKAAQQVDILVLDWMLEEPRFTAKDAVIQIVTAERRDRRLIAIYTTQRNLEEISKEIRDAVTDAREVEGNDLAIDVGGIRILIYHKGGPRIEKELEEYVCPQEELPEKLVAAFAEQTAGLVPAVALSALAATRENTHRLLDRLHQGLDLGYLGHLIRLVDREEGKKHLLDAIIGEFRAVVEDDVETGKVAIDGFSAWLTDHEEELGIPIDGIEKIGTALEDKTKKKEWKEQYGPLPEDITGILVDGDETSTLKSDASFAQLMAMRRPYSRLEPPLHLGTIVREQDSSDYYWLCIQPVCDSVRLTGPTAFLMLPVTPVDPGQRASFVVTTPDDSSAKQIFLHLLDGIADLERMRFAPTPSGAVVFTGDGDEKTVTTEGGMVLTWIAQLKPAHASRIAHAYGSQLSRVGLDESEWLRRLAKEGKKPDQRERPPLIERLPRNEKGSATSTRASRFGRRRSGSRKPGRAA